MALRHRADPLQHAITQDRPVEDRLAPALYIGNLLLAFVALAAMHLVERYDPQVIDEGCRRTFRVGSSIGLAVICAVALIVALTVPAIGRWAVWLLVFADPVLLAVQKTAGRIAA